MKELLEALEKAGLIRFVGQLVEGGKLILHYLLRDGRVLEVVRSRQ